MRENPEIFRNYP